MLALAGKDGEVLGSVPGLARLAGITLDEAQASLNELLSPDPHSRTPDYEGRRIAAIDGGWVILNHAKYRAKMSEDDRRAYKARKQAEYRAALAKCPPMSTSGQCGHNAESRVQKPEAENTNQSVKPPTAAEIAAAEIYQSYPRKQGKAAALKAIANATKAVPLDRLLERTKAYAAAVALWPESEKQYIPHPATWFNRGSYDDDPVTWVRNSTPAKPARQPGEFDEAW
jgi:hypothetical protein